MAVTPDLLNATTRETYVTLCQWMSGDFSNRQQSIEAPTLFAHIHIFFRPLPWDFFGGIGFYSEQVYDYNLWSPYRQGVHRCVAQANGDVYIENYKLNDPMLHAGAGRELSILHGIKPADITPRLGCSMVFRVGERSASGVPTSFVGGVEPGCQCLIPKEGQMTYLVSEVNLTDTTWQSRDIGLDPVTQQQIWGSEHGALQFEKIQSFASELPIDRLT